MTIENKDLLFQIALSRINGIGPSKFKALMDFFGSAEEVINAPIKKMVQVPGISLAIAKGLKQHIDLKQAEKQLKICQSEHIQVYSITDKDYPTLLKHCNDAPPILYYKGAHVFNTMRYLAVVGTRKNSEYGKHICEQLIKDLKAYNVCIVSGLAFGIDAIAHKAALKNDIPTIAVLANGLGKVYPPEHRNLAIEISKQGGLCSEYEYSQKSEKGHFPSRNRIVAGLCEATLVIETNIKGGSMITAQLANAYNRDVFAVPGRTTDTKSSGCNQLIKSMKASMLCSADDVASRLGWKQTTKPKSTQRQLFIELTKEEEIIYKLVASGEMVHLDELLSRTELSSSQLASALLSLEMQQIIRVLPGKMISLFN